MPECAFLELASSASVSATWISNGTAYFGASETLLGRFRVGHWKLDNGLTEDATHAGRLRGTRNLLFEVIHVGVCRRARLNHFERSKTGPGPHHFTRYSFRFRGKDVLLEPFLKPQVIGQSSI